VEVKLFETSRRIAGPISRITWHAQDVAELGDTEGSRTAVRPQAVSALKSLRE